MNFSNLFRLEENLNLDKKTLVILRWIAIIGQLTSINLVYYYLDLNFPIIETHFIILVGLLTNIFLQFRIKINQLTDTYSSLFLIYDLFQLSALLYLTGGISNPFSILLIVPSIVSSTFLSIRTTITLGTLTVILLLLLTLIYKPLPGIKEYGFTFPSYYLIGILISIIVGLVFLSYFGIRFADETKKRSKALNELQQVIAKEYELESLGGQAAAAAHSLGTPLSTINVVAKELKKEVGETSKLSKDLDLLLSQTERCSEILKQISQNKIAEDQFISNIKFEYLLEEIIDSFSEITDKKIIFQTKGKVDNLTIERSPEVVYGLRNFIGNAVKYSKLNIQIFLEVEKKFTKIKIKDDGPGFPEDIIKLIGEPYIKSKSKDMHSKAGLGLGTFLGKTLLERKKAKLNFNNNIEQGGAEVLITWKNEDLRINV